jgi:acetyl esterase
VTLNRQGRALLDVVDAKAAKPLAESTVAEARAAAWDWEEYMGEPEPVARVDHAFIPGPTAELPVRIYVPAGEGPFAGLVFFHGGGWVAGNIQLADRPNRSLANAIGCVLVAVNYQKAPEHPFPTAVDDCLAALEWTVRNAAALDLYPDRIGVGGDSAGGNLAAAVCLAARDRQAVQPAFQVLIYPATDAPLSTPSSVENAEGYGLTTADILWYWQQYLPDPADRDHPLACPLRAERLDGLAPAIVVTAEFDPLRDEGERYADRLAEAGVAVIRHRYEGTIHGFLWMATALDEYQRLLGDLREDLNTLLATQSKE